MGVGYGPNASWIVTWDNLKALVPSEAQAFEDALDAETVQDYCCEYQAGGIQVFGDEVAQAFAALVRTFEQVTQTDGASLSIEPGFHDPDDGDRYDDPEVNDAFFHVDGVEVLTPAGARFKDRLTRAMWVEFG